MYVDSACILSIVLLHADFRQRLMEKYDVFISVKPKSRQQQKSVLLKSLEQNAHYIYEAREVILNYTPSTPSPEVPAQPPAPPSYVQAPPTFHTSYPTVQMDPVTGDLDVGSSSSNLAVSTPSESQNGSGTVQPTQEGEGAHTSKPQDSGENLSGLLDPPDPSHQLLSSLIQVCV